VSEAGVSCPTHVLSWIAWYPDGGLTDAQRGAVEAHAARCAACREEIDVLAGRIETSVNVPDPERMFARVLALVESDGLHGEPAPVRPRPIAAPAARARAFGVRRRALGLAAAVALAVVAGGLGWLANGWLGAETRYRVASAPPTVPPPGGVELDVVFRSDAEAGRIHTALRGLGAVVVSGPSQLGRYRIQLPPGSEPSAAAALLRAEGAGVASYAEPVRR
jgi:hypothetical protein